MRDLLLQQRIFPCHFFFIFPSKLFRNCCVLRIIRSWWKRRRRTQRLSLVDFRCRHLNLFTRRFFSITLYYWCLWNIKLFINLSKILRMNNFPLFFGTMKVAIRECWKGVQRLCKCDSIWRISRILNSSDLFISFDMTLCLLVHGGAGGPDGWKRPWECVGLRHWCREGKERIADETVVQLDG